MAEQMVVIITDEHDHAATFSQGRYRSVLPVELCAHDHKELQEAIDCGSPRALVLMSILKTIGDEVTRKIDIKEQELKELSEMDGDDG